MQCGHCLLYAWPCPTVLAITAEIPNADDRTSA
jgi:hypothetical protein